MHSASIGRKIIENPLQVIAITVHQYFYKLQKLQQCILLTVLFEISYNKHIVNSRKGHKIMANLKDKIWLWGQTPGAHHFDYNLPGVNKMTPSEGLSFFGISNLCRLKMAREAEKSFLTDPWLGDPAKKLCLSLIGSGGEVPKLDMEPILEIAKNEPRV
ncbi:MAG: hypothetical protein J6Q54_01085, partial [Oscillospiraceae bacterium]|nr:hypothetical protein [Oscillospiraceae bacterium]